MRRSRRGGGHGLEMGGSGEDSFVAVVVTKLTGALLFILLLTMVIMALIPKANDTPSSSRPNGEMLPALAIVTPGALPEAIAGRPYNLALAATGGSGSLSWTLDGNLPDGLILEATSGVIRGTPKAGTPEPVSLVLRVADGSSHVSRASRILVLQPDLSSGASWSWKAKWPSVPWRSWMEQGFGFLVLAMMGLVGLNIISGLERVAQIEESDSRSRFRVYRILVVLATFFAAASLAIWLYLGVKA